MNLEPGKTSPAAPVPLDAELQVAYDAYLAEEPDLAAMSLELRDEVLAYAGRIRQAGGRAELHVWAGGIHAFDREVPEARISRAAVAARHDWLERLLPAG